MSEGQQFRKPDRRRAEPLWHQAEMALKAMIEQGEWATGSQIPNEDKLGAMLGISRITLRHALRNLEESGLLRREHGRGTFVRSATMVAGAAAPGCSAPKSCPQAKRSLTPLTCSPVTRC